MGVIDYSKSINNYTHIELASVIFSDSNESDSSTDDQILHSNVICRKAVIIQYITICPKFSAISPSFFDFWHPPKI